jgi:hypothetical protein
MATPATKLTITRPGGRWILVRGAITAPLAWAAMALTPLFLALYEAAGRQAFCRRCSTDTFAFQLDDGILSGGTRAIWIGAIVGLVLQGALLAARLRATGREPRGEWHRYNRSETSHLAFTAAWMALTVQALAITLALFVRPQPAHFYFTLAIAGFAFALLPSYLAWFILPAFHEQPKLEGEALLELEDA